MKTIALRTPILLALVATLFTALPKHARADEVKYVAHPGQALATMATMIAEAKKSIDLTYFIFDPCHASTQLLMNGLAKKAQSGVRVRVLLDSFMQDSAIRDNLAAYFSKHGIELRYYNNGFKYFFTGNFRTHVKILLVDGKSYVSGGRNIADEYFGLAQGLNFVDRDVHVTGASAKQVSASFQELWDAELTSAKPGNPASFRNWAQLCEKDQTSRIKDVQAYLKANSKKLIASMPVRTCKKVAYVTDSPDFGNPGHGQSKDPYEGYMSHSRLKAKRATDVFLSYMNGTKSLIEFENWSYMPDGRIDRAFQQLRARNVPVLVITNGETDGGAFTREAQDYLIAKLSARDTVGSQLVIQLSPQGSLRDPIPLTPKKAFFRLHGKVAVRDHKDVLVSSFNIDPRSYGTNLENVFIAADCPTLARDLESQYETLLKSYNDDLRKGKGSPPNQAGGLAKAFAIFGFTFL